MTRNSSFLRFMVVFMSYCPQFWGSRVIYMFQSYDQKLVFFAFYGHFHEFLPHSFGVSGRFTCLRVMTKKSSFSCFVDVFVSYCPQFWGSRAIYMFERYEQKMFVFAFYGHFHELLPQFWGSRAIYMFERYKQKLFVFA